MSPNWLLERQAERHFWCIKNSNRSRHCIATRLMSMSGFLRFMSIDINHTFQHGNHDSWCEQLRFDESDFCSPPDQFSFGQRCIPIGPDLYCQQRLLLYFAVVSACCSFGWLASDAYRLPKSFLGWLYTARFQRNAFNASKGDLGTYQFFGPRSMATYRICPVLANNFELSWKGSFCT